MHIFNTHYSSYHRKLPYVFNSAPLFPLSGSLITDGVKLFFSLFISAKRRNRIYSLKNTRMFRYFLKEILIFVILVKIMNVEARTLLNKFGKIYEDLDYPFYRQLPRGTVNYGSNDVLWI